MISFISYCILKEENTLLSLFVHVFGFGFCFLFCFVFCKTLHIHNRNQMRAGQKLIWVSSRAQCSAMNSCSKVVFCIRLQNPPIETDRMRRHGMYVLLPLRALFKKNNNHAAEFKKKTLEKSYLLYCRQSSSRKSV